MKKLIIFIVILVVIVWGYSYFNQNEQISPQEQEFNNSGQAKAIEDETDLWKFYDDSDVGFDIKYPHNVKLDGQRNEELSLIIRETNLEDLNLPGFGKEEALKDMISLSGGEYGSDFDWPIEISKKVRNLGDINAQEFMALSRFEVCDVVFERILVFYNNDQQVQIIVRGDKDEIINSMPEYFKIDETNCQDEKIWDFDKQEQFYEVLSKGKGSAVAQEWFDSFDDIVDTIELNNENLPVQASDKLSLLQGKWFSVDDENSVIEFKDNLKIDFYSGEKMFEGIFELNDNNLKVNENGEIFEYTINEISESNLILMFLPRGNILKYHKVI